MIRKAEAAEASAVAVCIDAAYAAHRQRLPDLPDVSAGCAEAIADGQVWVALREDRIFGVLMLAPEDGFLKLVNVAVHPQATGLGLGGALMARADAEAAAQGVSELRLATHADLPENVALYEHLGWRVTDREGRKVHMRKSL